MADHWNLVDQQRRVAADLFASLDDEQLGRPSLCEGWRVRDVFGHLAWVGVATPPEVVREVLLAGGRLHRAVDTQAKVYGSLDRSDLAARLAEGVGGRVLTPTETVEAVLADLVIHLQDVRRPLGLTADAAHLDPTTLVAALDQVTGTNRFVGGRRRAKGLRLVATDLDRGWGAGAEVAGPAEALLLAVAGRRAALADLSGDGLDRLAGRS